MKRLLFLALLALPAWPNACTLSASYNLSASGGHWTGTGCTGASYIPAAPDTVTLADGVTLTQDQNWTIGASGASNTTPAISAANTGNLVVNAGITLTLRGDALFNTPLTNPFLTFGAGSSLVFDASLSSIPTTTRYHVGGQQRQYRGIVFNGTSAAHVTVTSNLTNGALPGQFRTGNVGGGATYGMWNFAGTYVDFSNIGDGTTYGDAIYADCTTGATNDLFSLQHFTFTNSGDLYLWNGESTSNLVLSYGQWKNSAGTVALNPSILNGTNTFQHLSLDKPFPIFSLDGTASYNDIYFAQGIPASGVAIGGSNNFIRAITYTTPPAAGAMTNDYFLQDITANDNPHWTEWWGGTSVLSGNIFDQPDDVTSDSGEMWGGSTASGIVGTLENSILLPTKTGHGNSELGSLTSSSPIAGALLYLYHNTWVGSTAVGAFAMQQTNESGAALVPITAMESNLGWSNGGGYCKVGAVQTGSLLLNPVTLADYNYADANAIRAFGVVCSDGTCTSGTCPNSANSYFGNWSSATAQGPHDVDVLNPSVTHPYLADTTRNVATFDTAYLGNAAGAQWVTSHTYTVGQIVSDPKAGVYGGAMVNYICTVAHTSGSTTEPNVGASWRLDWQFASLTDIANATGAGTVITDGAIGCAAGCTMIQALEGWVKRGFTPQNPALWCSGHDSEAIGAVPFCAAGKSLLGLMGAI